MVVLACPSYFFGGGGGRGGVGGRGTKGLKKFHFGNLGSGAVSRELQITTRHQGSQVFVFSFSAIPAKQSSDHRVGPKTWSLNLEYP